MICFKIKLWKILIRFHMPRFFLQENVVVFKEGKCEPLWWIFQNININSKRTILLWCFLKNVYLLTYFHVLYKPLSNTKLNTNLDFFNKLFPSISILLRLAICWNEKNNFLSRKGYVWIASDCDEYSSIFWKFATDISKNRH